MRTSAGCRTTAREAAVAWLADRFARGASRPRSARRRIPVDTLHPRRQGAAVRFDPDDVERVRVLRLVLQVFERDLAPGLELEVPRPAARVEIRRAAVQVELVLLVRMPHDD